jgi:hypothetical protein
MDDEGVVCVYSFGGRWIKARVGRVLQPIKAKFTSPRFHRRLQKSGVHICMALPPQTGVTDPSVGLILAQGIDGPKRRGNPADQRQLKDKTNDPGERPPDR